MCGGLHDTYTCKIQLSKTLLVAAIFFFFFFLSKSLEDVQVIHQPGGPYWVPEALNTAEGGNQDSGEPFSPKRTHLGR